MTGARIYPISLTMKVLIAWPIILIPGLIWFGYCLISPRDLCEYHEQASYTALGGFDIRVVRIDFPTDWKGYTVEVLASHHGIGEDELIFYYVPNERQPYPAIESAGQSALFIRLKQPDTILIQAHHWEDLRIQYMFIPKDEN